jgi:hypothetical protein
LHPAYASYIEHQLNYAAGFLSASGARVVLLTAPCYSSGEQPDGTPWPEDQVSRVEAYNRLVRKVAAMHPRTVSVIDLYSMVCPGGVFETDIDGVPVRDSDGVHFTITGGAVLSPRIWPVVARIGHQ